MRKKRRAGKSEMLSRSVLIASFRASVGLHAVHRRGEEPEIECQPWLELRGTLEEPVKGVHNAVISLYPEDKLQVGTARPASVGAIIAMRPRMDIVMRWSHTEFDRVWALALFGRLSDGHLCFTMPQYNKGLVVSASFSNDREE
jgi:hypothetical protein